MKKSKMLMLSLVTLTSILVGNGLVKAAEFKSNVNVALEEAGIEEKPEIIDENLKPEENVITGQTGALTLDIVPNFDFDAQKISSNGNTFAINESKTTAMQVSDRRGTGEGWNVQVSLSKFETANQTKMLKGVSLKTQIIEAVTTEGNQNMNPLDTPAVELIAEEEPQVIFSAQKDAGMGSWLGYFSKAGNVNEGQKTTLHIPAGNYVGEYSASLTWTLENAPK